MSRQQFAFVVGVVLVWVAWDAGWIVLAAIVAGLIGIGIVRVMESDIDLGELNDRFRSSSSKRR